MLSESEREALVHIRHNIAAAFDFVDGYSFAKFKDDLKTFYAVTRALEIISEATRRLPQTLKDRHPTIPWRDVAGAGNIYRHDYEDVQERIVWATLHQALPMLSAMADTELEAHD